MLLKKLNKLFIKTTVVFFTTVVLNVSIASEHIYSYPIEVIRVKDGDTFVAKIGLGLNISILSTVRLKGYDAPEDSWRAKSLSERKLGEEATGFLDKLDKKNWVLEIYGRQRDSFGRVLGNVVLPDGGYLKTLMVEKGYVKN